MSEVLPTEPISKEERHRQIISIISKFDVTSQGQIVEKLKSNGIEATQATVSRDLDALGISKGRLANGQEVYIPPSQPDLTGVLRMYAREIASSGTLCVIKTPPGAGPPVAAALDAANLPDLLATIQGDDTVLGVAREPASGKELAQKLQSIIKIQ